MASRVYQIVAHPSVKTVDYPLIRQQLGADFINFRTNLEREIDLIQKNGNNNGSSACEHPPLLDYRKKKFYSKIPQPVNSKPNMRLIYRLDESNKKLFILGIGLRLNERPINTQDIYQRLRLRDQSIY